MESKAENVIVISFPTDTAVISDGMAVINRLSHIADIFGNLVQHVHSVIIQQSEK